MTSLTSSQPHVYLVGAGPGDPELLTLKAAKTIAMATVLLVDDLMATGGTMLAAVRLIKRLKAEVLEACAIIDLRDLGGSALLRNEAVRVFSLLAIDSGDDTH